MLREVALSLPQVEELDHFGTPSFRVNGKIFAQMADGEKTALIKLTLAEQTELLAVHREAAWLPAHWGNFGWTYIRISACAPDQIRMLVERSWQLVAPKKLAAKFRARPRV